MSVTVLGSSTGASARVPDAPTLVSVDAGDGSAVVTWAPAGDGGSPIIQFIVTVRVGATTVLTRQASGSARSLTLIPLTNTTTYTVTVAALNAIGISAASPAGTVTPTAGSVVTPPPPTGGGSSGGGGVPVPPTTQPVLYAFPVERAFRPEHWLLTAEEADAL